MRNIIILVIISAVTFGLRSLPFLLFGDRPLPAYVIRLSNRIPILILGLLVVYSLKSTDLLVWPHGVPEAIAIIVLVILHKVRRNALLSITVSTVTYAILIQTVFR